MCLSNYFISLCWLRCCQGNYISFKCLHNLSKKTCAYIYLVVFSFTLFIFVVKARCSSYCCSRMSKVNLNLIWCLFLYIFPSIYVRTKNVLYDRGLVRVFTTRVPKFACLMIGGQLWGPLFQKTFFLQYSQLEIWFTFIQFLDFLVFLTYL